MRVGQGLSGRLDQSPKGRIRKPIGSFVTFLTDKALPCRAYRNAERACAWAAPQAASGLGGSNSLGGGSAVAPLAEAVQNSSKRGSGRGSVTECTMSGPWEEEMGKIAHEWIIRKPNWPLSGERETVVRSSRTFSGK